MPLSFFLCNNGKKPISLAVQLDFIFTKKLEPMIQSITRCFSALALLVACSVGYVWGQTPFFTETFGGPDFPAGWTSVVQQGNNQPTSAWFRTTTGPAGDFPISPLASTTAANGWMIFDSDLNCNIGVGQNAWLISPPLNTTGRTQIFLKFQTFYRNFYDVCNVRVGTNLNDLNNWATFPVFPNVAPNAYGGGSANVNPQNININISSAAADQAQVYFAFQFRSTPGDGPGNLIGCAYAWQVDDVELLEGDPRAPNDMRVNTFFAFAPNAATPVSQRESFGFIADIQNVGSQAQPGSTLSVIIENSDEEEIYRDSIRYGSIAVDSVAENVFFPNEYTPLDIAGVYFGRYELTLDSGPDANPENNFQEFIFAITDSTFSKELYATRSVAPAADESYTYGNVFYVPNGDNFAASSISFRVANASQLTGRSVTLLLYKWNGDVNDNFRVDPAEYENVPIAFNSYIFTGDEQFNIITVPVNEDNSVASLESDKYYIAAVQYATDDDQAFFLLANDDFDYAATVFYTDSLDKPRYASALDVGNSGSFSLIGFGYDIVPVVRLNIRSLTNTQEPTLDPAAVAVYPNPADHHATLALNLEAPSAEVEIIIMDVAGKVLSVQRHQNLQREQLNLSTAHLPSGAYNVRVRTDKGVAVKRLLVQH